MFALFDLFFISFGKIDEHGKHIKNQIFWVDVSFALFGNEVGEEYFSREGTRLKVTHRQVISLGLPANIDFSQISSFANRSTENSKENNITSNIGYLRPPL